jgi:hypothetical protein
MSSRGSACSPKVWFGVGLLASALCGCTTRLQSDPTTFDVRQDATPSLRAQGVALVNAYSAPVIVVVAQNRGSKVEADLREFTSTAIGILERRMKKDGLTMDPNATKRVTLRMKDVSVLFDGFASLGTVTVEADLANGAKRTFRIKNNTSSGGRALDGAALRGVVELLKDEQFLAYMNGS